MTFRLRIFFLILLALGIGYFFGYYYSKKVYLQAGREAVEKMTEVMIQTSNDRELLWIDLHMTLLKNVNAGETELYKRKLCFLTSEQLKRLKSLRYKYVTGFRDPIPPYVLDAKKFVDEQTEKGNCSPDAKSERPKF